MARFEGRPGDLEWGEYNYKVTRTQWDALSGIMYMMKGMPKQPDNDKPVGFFCSQSEIDGEVIIGVMNHSMAVNRNGRINQESQE